MVRLRGYQMGGQGLVPCLRSLHFGAWNPYDVPADRDVRLAVINGGGTVHSLVFPCRRVGNSWVDTKSRRSVEVYPTHWQEWMQKKAGEA